MTLMSDSGGRTIEIDRDRCMGSGNCGFYAPATFDLGDDMKAFVLDPAGDPDEKIALAIEGCPTLAIRRIGD
jgi:ferredoxin